MANSNKTKDSNKGELLNERVWRLFRASGFQTKPNENDNQEYNVKFSRKKERPIDLLAIDEELGVRIVAENTTKKNLGVGISKYITEMEEIVKKTQSDVGLLTFTEKELRDSDIEYAKSKNVYIWDKYKLDYFESIANTIGSYAKYEIIKFLNVKTDEQKVVHNILAIKLRQPFSDSEYNLYMFTANPELLLKICTVERKAQGNADAYQRMVKKSRLNQIKKFVTRQKAILPPNVILHFEDAISVEPIEIPSQDSSKKKITITNDKNCELVMLRVPTTYGSMELIDGQHRLYGFANAEPATKKEFNLVVLGLENLPDNVRKETFVSINDKAKRVDANLVAYLKYTDDENKCQKDPELMAIKVVIELSKRRIFKDRIRLIDLRNSGNITLKGFSGYDLKTLLGPNGHFRKYYPNKSSEFITVLDLYFGIIKKKFQKEWDNPETYIISTNRGISAFLKLLKSIFKTEKKQLSKTMFEKYIGSLKKNWKESWVIKELNNSYVGSGGWIDFHMDMVKSIKKDYSKFKE